MRPSIRTFLLINLLLSVTLITSLAIILNLYLAHKDIQTQLDAQLIRSAVRMQAFFSGTTVEKHRYETIQKTLNTQLAPIGAGVDTSKDTEAQKEARYNLTFQIWNANGQLVLRSPGAPKIPLSTGKTGLSTLWLEGTSWRVNTVYNPRNGQTIMVSEKSNYREQLENQLTKDTILIMLIAYPFLGFLIWIIVGRGLSSLKRVADAVKRRAPTFLKPVSLESVPSEIEPLIVELNSLFERLAEAFVRNKRFTADAAHELKTPLAALSTQTQVALRAETKEARNQALMKVLASVNRSTHMVQQLLTLSRMDPEAHVNEPTKIILAKQAAEVAMRLAPQAIAKNIELELLAPNSTASILGNEASIDILIRNLLDNAIRYTQENGFVNIDIQETENTVQLLVTDNGPGIPDDLKNRVFERFYRVIGNRSTGSGLGLGIVQQIAKLHRATVEIETPDNGEGVTFKVTFTKYVNEQP